MLSAVIPSEHSYRAVPLARQLVHQRFVPFGPLVLERTPLKNQRLQQIGDQPVSRMLSTVTNSTDCNFIHLAMEADIQSLRAFLIPSVLPSDFTLGVPPI